MSGRPSSLTLSRSNRNFRTLCQCFENSPTQKFQFAIDASANGVSIKISLAFFDAPRACNINDATVAGHLRPGPQARQTFHHNLDITTGDIYHGYYSL